MKENAFRKEYIVGLRLKREVTVRKDGSEKGLEDF